jgi:hypothetical protein
MRWWNGKVGSTLAIFARGVIVSTYYRCWTASTYILKQHMPTTSLILSCSNLADLFSTFLTPATPSKPFKIRVFFPTRSPTHPYLISYRRFGVYRAEKNNYGTTSLWSRKLQIYYLYFLPLRPVCQGEYYLCNTLRHFGTPAYFLNMEDENMVSLATYRGWYMYVNQTQSYTPEVY